MIRKILIANRGEIACRIARTARRMGIRTAAVFSEADRGALHVEAADEAWLIGPAAARESYLHVERIVAAAARAGADALHPGYGFLSEDPALAEACAAADIAFIGPPAEVMRLMGSKSAAKARMEAAGVPVVPGYHGDAQEAGALARAAEDIGYPVLLKASAGGGGRGMRRVDSPAAFAAALEGARREAKAAFGDDRMLVERYLERPRHVEVQVFGDRHGRVLHLYDRDCSIQRRHQKVLEEAPAPGLSPAQHAGICEAAVAAARAVGYSSAGTVEFILAPDGSFYFMEMNTRLQVEHPVTEMIAGLDLVEWQIRVAAGEPLPLSQEAIRCDGHAIEVRLYAEDPARGFLPASGRLAHLRLPAGGAHVRIDAGVREGDPIGVHYDPLLAKLIVWDRDRPAAVARLQWALAELQVGGVVTNAAFLARLAHHAAFAAAELDTAFIERHRAALLPEPGPAPPAAFALAAAFLAARRPAPCGIRRSPWDDVSGWRLNQEPLERLVLRDGERLVSVELRRSGAAFLLDLAGGRLAMRVEAIGERDLVCEIDGHVRRATLLQEGGRLTLFLDGAAYRLDLVDPLAQAAARSMPAGRLVAPMPGRVVSVLVQPGDSVARGAALMVLEAMKMEHTIAAPANGTVAELRYGVGDLVEEGAELLRLAEGPA